MWIQSIVVLVLGTTSTLAIWSCSTNSDCGDLRGSICNAGNCECPSGMESTLGGTVCADSAPYYTSSCVEDFQCSRLQLAYQCRKADNNTQGICSCLPGYHYLRGRCWQTSSFGESCSNNEECFQYDSHSFTCNGTCVCSDGYYSRQNDECRKIATSIEDNCVLDADCQFENASCNQLTLQCEIPTSNKATLVHLLSETDTPVPTSTRQHGQDCSSTTCSSPFICSKQRACVCPVGYYPDDEGVTCLAELGSSATSEQCVGVFKEIRGGLCTCQANFYYNTDLRSCAKASRNIADSCITDANCITFGPAICGQPKQWGIRYCECDAERSVWDAEKVLCRYFAGVGETCQVNSDCLAGELEIQCVPNSEGQGICTCPEGFIAVDGLCLTSGLGLNDVCQSDLECTGTSNLQCQEGLCTCDNGYQADGGVCVPAIGGICSQDSDCFIEGTVCTSVKNVTTCQCGSNFVEDQDECWPTASGHNATCTVDAQCLTLGDAACVGGHCDCASGYHFQNGGCWRQTGLFEECSRSSECFLSDAMDRVECRNGRCQCDFRFAYSETLNTCMSSASNLLGSVLVITTALLYLYSI